MAFSWKSFLLNLAEVGPIAVELALGIKHEVPSASRAQLATDSLHAATGIADVLLTGNPEDQQAASAAANIVQSYITAVSGGSLGKTP